MILTIGCIIAIVLAIIAIVEAGGRSWVGWGLVVLAGALLIGQLT